VLGGKLTYFDINWLAADLRNEGPRKLSGAGDLGGKQKTTLAAKLPPHPDLAHGSRAAARQTRDRKRVNLR